MMKNFVVVGMQWGDEGKGKIVDYLAEHFDIVARFQGGSNAGHTVKHGEETYKLRIIPTGSIRGKTAVIGNGVVIDPFILRDEIQNLRSSGIDFDVVISPRAHVITPFHIKLDELEEEAKSDSKVGTTKRGIGPTYCDKISRIGVRVGDLLSTEKGFSRRNWGLLEAISRERIETLHSSSMENEIMTRLSEFFSVLESLRPFVRESGEYLHSSIKSGKRVLFEGAQGTLLDIDHGTYPYVTSSNCVSSAAATGTGISFKHLHRVLGIVKAYTTRVGEGPFPTELHDEMARHILEKGHEYGTVTGRPRRCGWLDLVALRYASRINGTDYLALTKADVLSGVDPLKVCVGYAYDGEEFNDFPSDLAVLSGISPIYEELPGWRVIEPNSVDDLPAPLREYISVVEKWADAKVGMVSYGPDRFQTIVFPEFVSDVLEFNDDNGND